MKVGALARSYVGSENTRSDRSLAYRDALGHCVGGRRERYECNCVLRSGRECMRAPIRVAPVIALRTVNTTQRRKGLVHVSRTVRLSFRWRQFPDPGVLEVLSGDFLFFCTIFSLSCVIQPRAGSGRCAGCERLACGSRGTCGPLTRLRLKRHYIFSHPLVRLEFD